jgi:hypothetical protein
MLFIHCKEREEGKLGGVYEVLEGVIGFNHEKFNGLVKHIGLDICQSKDLYGGHVKYLDFLHQLVIDDVQIVVTGMLN